MRVLAFTGLPGAGKTAAVEAGAMLRVPLLRMGDLVRQEARTRGLPMTDPAVGTLAAEMRRTEGMDVWARRAVERVRRDHGSEPIVVIEGVRNPEEIERFRRDLDPELHLVAIVSSEEVRIARLHRRGREDAPKSREEARQREERERAWGIEKVLEMAGTIVTNEGSLDDLRRQIVDVMRAHVGRAAARE